MSATIRHITRGTVVIGTAALALGLAAAPALAAPAEGQLTKLPPRMNINGAANLTGGVHNTTREPLENVQILWAIRLTNLKANEVSLSGLQIVEQNRQILAAEQIGNLEPGRTHAVSHSLKFLKGAPTGRVTVIMQVSMRDRGRQRTVDQASTTTTLQAPSPTPSAKATTPEPTEEALTDPTTAAASGAPPVVAAGPPPPAHEEESHWLLYSFGGLLVAGGVGIGVWLLRRPRDTPDDEPEMALAPHGAGPDDVWLDAPPPGGMGPGAGPSRTGPGGVRPGAMGTGPAVAGGMGAGSAMGSGPGMRPGYPAPAGVSGDFGHETGTFPRPLSESATRPLSAPLPESATRPLSAPLSESATRPLSAPLYDSPTRPLSGGPPPAPSALDESHTRPLAHPLNESATRPLSPMAPQGLPPEAGVPPTPAGPDGSPRGWAYRPDVDPPPHAEEFPQYERRPDSTQRFDRYRDER